MKFSRGGEGAKPLARRALLLAALLSLPVSAAELALEIGPRRARVEVSEDRFSGDGVDLHREGRVWTGRISGRLTQLELWPARVEGVVGGKPLRVSVVRAG